MRRARAKLQSQRGASLSIALLLFLVCVVVGTVVLTAGTAAAGRLSELADMDRRYYSVTSAAELLAKELTGVPVTIQRSRSQETQVTREFFRVLVEDPIIEPEEPEEPQEPEEGPEGEEPSEPVVTYHTEIREGSTTTRKTATYHTEINGTPLTDITATTYDGTDPSSGTGTALSTSGMSLLTARAVELMYGGAACNTDEALEYSFSLGRNTETAAPFTLGHGTAGGVDTDDLAVQGTIRMRTDGTLILTLQDEDAGDHYTVVLTLKPHVTESESTENGGSSTPVVVNTEEGFDQVVTTTTRTTKTASITWTVSSIQ